MQYFKNTQIADLYAVSKRTVTSWVEAAKEGKLPLQLQEVNGKSFIANTTSNMSLIEDLVQKGKKYKNSRGQKITEPLPEFYKLYDRKQIFDIINNIDVYREIPRQYNYFSKGAEYWDSYASRLWSDPTPNVLNSTVELLSANVESIDNLLGDANRVNVIDIGPGNALPVKELLTHLVYELNVMAKYIAVDISSEMIEIARRNIEEWFGDKVNFEGHVRDITHERFNDLVAEDSLVNGDDAPTNLVLFLGGTAANFRCPNDSFKTICNSMARQDIILYSKKLDTPKARRFFDFSPTSNHVETLEPQRKFLVDLLGIEESFYTVETGFDPIARYRYLRIRLKYALSIKFTFEKGERMVDIGKGESILIWRAWHQTTHETINQFEETGFAILQTSTTQNREFILVAAAVDTPSQLQI